MTALETFEKTALLGQTIEDLESFAKSLGEPAYRGRQIADWIYRRGAAAFEEMSDLPKRFRERLGSEAPVGTAQVAYRQTSGDGTVKFLLELADGERIETVYLPYEDRASVCVSSQAGCPMACDFCATGKSGYRRNLAAGEIVDQVLCAQRFSGRRIDHVVFMGMGEPLLNLPNLLKSIRLLNREVGIAQRQIAVSTVGLIPAIRELAREKLRITLAVSLHSPEDSVRARLMPAAKKYPVTSLVRAAAEYAEQTGRRVTYEYTLLKGINDTPEQARLLARLLKGAVCAVNLIPFNPIGPGGDYARPDGSRIARFRLELEEAGIAVTQRAERGRDIAAACGQLRRRMETEHVSQPSDGPA
ncbi:MAG: 23S rRNA (adenine(2503)-C(2))-methyltransferase RlmN [Armatimonadetes bacterium]|nr:23S rRNA (adenine(2503)-C(2))-methyltransferase RlmN [Armatimonadota bacterium]